MKRSLLSFGLLAAGLAEGVPTTIRQCDVSTQGSDSMMLSSQAKLRIHMLGQTASGEQVLAIGGYSASKHRQLYKALTAYDPSIEILTAGEMEVSWLGAGKPVEIHRVNETSSFLRFDLKKQGTIEAWQKLSWGSKGSLKKASGFRAFPYSADNLRLEARMKGDFRHDFANKAIGLGYVVEKWTNLSKTTTSQAFLPSPINEIPSCLKVFNEMLSLEGYSEVFKEQLMGLFSQEESQKLADIFAMIRTELKSVENPEARKTLEDFAFMVAYSTEVYSDGLFHDYVELKHRELIADIAVVLDVLHSDNFIFSANLEILQSFMKDFQAGRWESQLDLAALHQGLNEIRKIANGDLEDASRYINLIVACPTEKC